MGKRLVLMLDGFNIDKAKKYGCTSLADAYTDEPDIGNPYVVKSTLEWDKVKYSQDDYMHQLYAELSKFWIRTLSIIWSKDHTVIVSPVLKFATNDFYEEFLYKRIEHYPFIHSMLLPGSEVRLVVTGLQLHSPVHTP